LDSIEVAGLIPIAENSKGTAGVRARSILEYGYDHKFFNCPDISGTTAYKNSNLTIDDFSRMHGVEITVEPNPAGEWTAFSYKLPDNINDGIIKITDTYGKIIETIIVSENQGHRIWNTENVTSGVYYYTLTVSGFNKSGKIVISN